MDEDEDMDIDGLQRKVSLTLVGELYSLIAGTPDEELEASLLDGLYEVVALQAEPNRIMRLRQTKEGAKVSRGTGRAAPSSASRKSQSWAT
jgi:hypothetical protein